MDLLTQKNMLSMNGGIHILFFYLKVDTYCFIAIFSWLYRAKVINLPSSYLQHLKTNCGKWKSHPLLHLVQTWISLHRILLFKNNHYTVSHNKMRMKVQVSKETVVWCCVSGRVRHKHWFSSISWKGSKLPPCNDWMVVVSSLRFHAKISQAKLSKQKTSSLPQDLLLKHSLLAGTSFECSWLGPT